jgi:hypothetical protein
MGQVTVPVFSLIREPSLKRFAAHKHYLDVGDALKKVAASRRILPTREKAVWCLTALGACDKPLHHDPYGLMAEG